MLKKVTSLQGHSEHSSDMSEKERVEKMCRAMNSQEGNLNSADGYDCPECKNKGFVFYVDEVTYYGNTFYTEMSKSCHCMKTRESIRRLKQSGLSNTIDRCTFDRYEATEDWQKLLKDKAMDFAQNVDSMKDKWFFVGGAVGCGKTHICTAIAGEMLKAGKQARYMLWEDEVTKLKAVVNDDAKYSEMIEPIKRAEVLYIDDFLRESTPADIKRAYEIINYRYQQPQLITIISSERYISEIEAIDSAIGSRIYEKTKGNACNIARNQERNYRIKGGLI